MKAPVDKGLPFLGHSIEFNRDALKFSRRLQKKNW